MAEQKKTPSNELQSFEGATKMALIQDQKHSQDTPDASPNATERPKRINPDSKPMLWTMVILVVLLGSISFTVSFAGLVAVAEWAQLPEHLRWAVPVFIDAAILIYSTAILIHRHRGEPTWASWLTLGAFTILSVLANVGHVLLSTAQGINFQAIIGALVAGMAPIGVFAATEELGRLAIERPHKRKKNGATLVHVGDDRPNPTPPSDTTRHEDSAFPDEIETVKAPVADPVASDDAELEQAVAHHQAPVVVGKNTDEVETNNLVNQDDTVSPVANKATRQASNEEAFVKVERWVSELSPADLDWVSPSVKPVVESLSSVRRSMTTDSTPSAAVEPELQSVAPVPALEQPQDTLKRSAESVAPPANETPVEPARKPLASVHYLDRGMNEEQKIEALLTEFGADITAQQLAEAMGKTVRTGQRKLAALKTKHPEIFGSENASSKESSVGNKVNI